MQFLSGQEKNLLPVTLGDKLGGGELSSCVSHPVFSSLQYEKAYRPVHLQNWSPARRTKEVRPKTSPTLSFLSSPLPKLLILPHKAPYSEYLLPHFFPYAESRSQRGLHADHRG